MALAACRGAQAGRDVSAATYGDFIASLTAGRDVGSMYGGGGVWARGDIRGNIVAERSIGRYHDGSGYYGSWFPPVFAFGEISAQILARNSSQDPYGGTIGTVAAWGPIAGRIEAETSIGTVGSGGAVTAEIRAPHVGAVIENDSSILTDYDYPDVPDSIRDDILAEAAAARDELLADRANLAAEIDQLMADFADERDRAFADFATARADLDKTIEEVASAAQMVDQRGTTHVYEFDALGRQTQDRVTVLGRGVDGAVRRIETGYEARGMRQRVTSYDRPTARTGNALRVPPCGSIA